MSSTKLLKSVCHNIAAHAVGGLCYFPRHFITDCLKVDRSSETIRFVGDPLLPENIVYSRETLNTASALKEKFEEMLKKHGFSIDELDTAEITFEINAASLKSYIFQCHSRIKTKSGQSFEDYVSSV